MPNESECVREESWGELQQGIVTKVSLAFVAVAWLGWYRVLLNETRDGRLMVVSA